MINSVWISQTKRLKMKHTSKMIHLLLLISLVFPSLTGLTVQKLGSAKRVLVLQVYPRLFKFDSGAAVLYYKQMGKGSVNAYLNGTEITQKCYKIRFIYGTAYRISGFWVKCQLSSHYGTFIVKTPLGVDRYRNFDTYKM